MTERFFVSPVLLAEMMTVDIEAQLKQLRHPITIFHGEKDDMVPVAISRELAGRNSNLNLLVFNNMEHGFTDAGDETGDTKATLGNISRILNTITRGRSDE